MNAWPKRLQPLCVGELTRLIAKHNDTGMIPLPEISSEKTSSNRISAGTHVNGVFCLMSKKEIVVHVTRVGGDPRRLNGRGGVFPCT